MCARGDPEGEDAYIHGYGMLRTFSAMKRCVQKRVRQALETEAAGLRVRWTSVRYPAFDSRLISTRNSKYQVCSNAGSRLQLA